MTSKISRLGFSIAVCAVSLTAQAADSARAQLDHFTQGLKSLSASFDQQVLDADGGPGKSSRGTLALRAPRQFRWDTTAPFKQLIVADGEKVWVYDADLEQVTVRSQGSEEAHSPLTVLTDIAQLDHDFSASEQGEHDGFSWLRLKSRDKDPQFEYCDLGFDNGGLERMRFKDSFGNTTEIRFAKWQRNPQLPSGDFNFVPPKGVDVVGDPTPAAQAFPIKN